MPKYPLNTDDQNRILRQRILAYREALRRQKELWELAQEANRAWKKAQDHSDELKETLAGYVDKHVNKVVVTIDGGNIACLIQFVETYGVTAGVHVSFLPVFGYEPSPPVESGEIELEPLPERFGGDQGPRYEYAGKLGPWSRNKDPEDSVRYLAVGPQEKPTYKRIAKVEPDEDGGRRYLRVWLEDGEDPTHQGCNRNTYVKR